MGNHYGYVITADDKRQLYRLGTGDAPLILEACETCLGYWETRAEFFAWACEKIGVNPYAAEYEAPETGELLTYDDLLEEEYEYLYSDNEEVDE